MDSLELADLVPGSRGEAEKAGEAGRPLTDSRCPRDFCENTHHHRQGSGCGTEAHLRRELLSHQRKQHFCYLATLWQAEQNQSLGNAREEQHLDQMSPAYFIPGENRVPGSQNGGFLTCALCLRHPSHDVPNLL